MSQFKLPDYQTRPVPATRSGWPQDLEDWGHRYMNPRAFWDQGFDGEGILFILIDTGVDATHPDLIGQVIHAKDFTGENSPGFDGNGHGTWCASRLAARLDGQGVVGIAPRAKIVDLRALDSGGSGPNAGIAAAYRYGKTMTLPAPYNTWRRIFSVSLGGPVADPGLKRALEEVVLAAGLINIVAAGNDGHRTGGDTVNYPAKWDNLSLAVGALDEDADLADYSSVGPSLDVVAPGTWLRGAWPGGGYMDLRGTSMATPGVAGAVGLLVQKYGDDLRTQEDVEIYLQTHAKDLLTPGWDMMTGSGSVILTRYLENPPVVEEPESPEPEPEEPVSGGVPGWVWALVGVIVIGALVIAVTSNK